MKNYIPPRYFRFLPMVGILIFIGLYLIAASVYPGGSHLNKHFDGYDWVNNYWCNLTENYAINGSLNPAKPFATSAVFILSISLAYFFFEFPFFFKLKNPWHIIVPLSGVASSILISLIHSKHHDSMALLASLSGILAIIGMFFGLRKKGLIYFIWTGSLCVILVALNGYIYFTGNYIDALPLIQKITFAAALLWFFILNSMFGMSQEIIPIKEVYRSVKNKVKKL